MRELHSCSLDKSNWQHFGDEVHRKHWGHFFPGAIPNGSNKGMFSLELVLHNETRLISNFIVIPSSSPCNMITFYIK